MAAAPLPALKPEPLRSETDARCDVPNQHSETLLSDARRGNPTAFLALVTPCEKSVYRNALRLTGNRTDAEDVIQETFIKAYTRLSQFSGDCRGGVSAFVAWFSRIAANESIDTLRRRHVGRVISLDDPIPGGDQPESFRQERSVSDDPEQHYARMEMRRILADEIEQLDPSFRRVCLLRDVAQLSTQETAERLGISSAAVRIRLFRARLKLRDRLQQIFRDPVNQSHHQWTARPKAAAAPPVPAHLQ